MAKLLLLSVIIFTVAAPIRMSRQPDPNKALRSLVITFCWFNLAYVFALAYFVPRIL